MPTLDLKTTKSKVEWCLKNRPNTREDDTLLALSVWKNFYRSDFENLLIFSLKSLEIDFPHIFKTAGGDMNKLPSFESCRRLRQKFNEQGLYLPEDETVLKRRGKVGEVLDFLTEEKIS